MRDSEAVGRGGHIDFDLSRSDVENLLAGFLIGAVGIRLGARLTDSNALPPDRRKHVRAAEAAGSPGLSGRQSAGRSRRGAITTPRRRSVSTAIKYWSNGVMPQPTTIRFGATATPNDPPSGPLAAAGMGPPFDPAGVRGHRSSYSTRTFR
jgi:hypothetical protein